MFNLSSITLMHKNCLGTFIDLGVALIGISMCRTVVGE